MDTRPGILAGLRVLDFGHYIAAPLAGVFLADQGAEVIRVVRPGAQDWDPPTQAALARGKRPLEVNLKDLAEREHILSLAADCDILLENFRPGVMARLGLGYAAIEALNPAVIYVSIPGYSRHDPRSALSAWDGTISAACGFFTDLSLGGAALDLPPTHTPLPLPSVYAGLWAAIAATSALYARQTTGRGNHLETPLLDAAMSAAAGVIFQLVDQPKRYNAPPLPRKLLDAISLRRLPRSLAVTAHTLVAKLMPAFFNNYRCADGKLLFLCAIDNANQIAKLIDATGLRNEVQELGFVFGDVMDSPPIPNNIHAYRGSSRAWNGLRKLLAKRFFEEPADVWVEKLALAGVPAIRQRSLAQWLLMPEMVHNAVLVRTVNGELQPAAQVDVQGAASATPVVVTAERSGETGMHWQSERAFSVTQRFGQADNPQAAPLAGVKVLDLTNVIAGPVAGRTLAELGANVIHLSPNAPKMGPRLTLLMGLEVNQGKRSLAVDLCSQEGRDILKGLLPATDVVIYNKLPAQAERLGVAPEQVHGINPRTVISAITAYSGMQPGSWEDRPGYDPIIQTLTGIMTRFGGAERPAVHGIASCIDYFTGYAAAFGAIAGLVAHSRGETRLVSRTSLLRTAAWVQLPFVCNPTRDTLTGLDSLGGPIFDRLYRARDGWLHLGPDPRSSHHDSLTPHGEGPSAAELRTSLRREIGARSLAAAVDWVNSRGYVAGTLCSARTLRKNALQDMAATEVSPTRASGLVRLMSHPCGEKYFAPAATWVRGWDMPNSLPEPAPFPGQHSRQILQEAGFSPERINGFLASGVVVEKWLDQGYLPY